MLGKAGAFIALTLAAAPASAGLISDQIYPAPQGPLTLRGLDPAATLIVVTTDGLRLNGIMVAARGKPTLLVFHGNGSSAADAIRWFEPLIAQGDGIVAAECRGYSANPGKPDEAGLAADTNAFLAIARARAEDAPVWVVGHSLGGGVALGLARHQKLDAFVTIGTFTRLRAVASKAARPFLPDAYRNIDAVPLLDELWYLIHGTADDVVPVSEAKALYDAAVVAKTNGAAFVLKGVGHHPDGAMLAAVFAVIGRHILAGTYEAKSLPTEAQLVPFGASAPLNP